MRKKALNIPTTKITPMKLMRDFPKIYTSRDCVHIHELMLTLSRDLVWTTHPAHSKVALPQTHLHICSVGRLKLLVDETAVLPHSALLVVRASPVLHLVIGEKVMSAFCINQQTRSPRLVCLYTPLPLPLAALSHTYFSL